MQAFENMTDIAEGLTRHCLYKWANLESLCNMFFHYVNKHLQTAANFLDCYISSVT